jgi:phosphoglycolate phosphatase
MSIRAVLFDKDGTLIDVNATWIPIYREMLMDIFGTDLAGAEALMAKAGYDKASEKFLAGSILAGGTTRQLVEVFWPGLDHAAAAEKVKLLDHGYTHLVRERLTPLMPLAPILAELRAMGMKLGVATNDSHVSATAHMTQVGVIGEFDGIIAADTVPVPKPSGHMIRKFSEMTGLPPSAIAMVGDNHHDMEEARNGGAGLAVAVLSGNAAHEDIAHLADHTLASIAELPALLRAL